MSRRNNSETDERREKKQRTYNIDERDYWARDDRMAEADEQRQSMDRFVPKDGPLRSCPESRGSPSPCVRCGCAESKNGWYWEDGGYECWECAVFGQEPLPCNSSTT